MEVSWLFFLSFFRIVFPSLMCGFGKIHLFPEPNVKTLCVLEKIRCRNEDFDIFYRSIMLVHFLSKNRNDLVYEGENDWKRVHIWLVLASWFWCLIMKVFFAFSPWTGALIVILRTRPKLQIGEQKVPKKQKRFSVGFNQFRYNTKLLCQPYL